MEILRYLLIVVEVICCLLLIGVILLQQSKSQGMGLAFGGGMGETLFGSRAGNVLTKATVTLALIFLANTTVLGILFTTRQEKSLLEQIPVAAQAPLPVTPAPASGPELMTAPPSTPATTFFPSEETMMPVTTDESGAGQVLDVNAVPVEEVAPPASDDASGVDQTPPPVETTQP